MANLGIFLPLEVVHGAPLGWQIHMQHSGLLSPSTEGECGAAHARHLEGWVLIGTRRNAARALQIYAYWCGGTWFFLVHNTRSVWLPWLSSSWITRAPMLPPGPL